ncbi:D-glucuronyl C5-epimerase family protein [Knoellia locipacati]|uniref:D-glucuronyl C5-epimerase family protein n=1 Tax=Knoellia locipacati TaxID=882824 RepID=UPI003850276F
MRRSRTTLISLLAAAAVAATTPLAGAQPRAAVAASSPTVAVTAAEPGDNLLDMGGLDGTPLRPTRDVAAVKKRQAAVRETTTQSSPGLRLPTDPPISGFLSSGATLVEAPTAARPYDTTKITPGEGWGVRDSTDVRMFSFVGETKQWNHPVGQAQYALYSLNSYRLTKDQAYLDSAAKNAQRLVDRRVESGGAWYYPYDFDFAVHGDTTETLKAPWYSGMAQGQALSVFVRLFQVTGDEKWKTAADATYASMRQTPEGEAPFASWVDEKGRLWLEEYPRYPVVNSEKVLNGHIFALYGLHDYWVLTQNEEVRALTLGALRTVELTVPAEYRRQGAVSVYSLRHKVSTHSYHSVHVRQFLELWRLTKSQVFYVNTANTYRSDYPLRGGTGTAVITPRVTKMYKADNFGKITATKAVSFGRTTGAPFDHRVRLQGGPIGLRLSAGTHTGWFVPEGFGVAFARGAVDAHAYLPKVTIQFTPKTFTAYRLDAAGNVSGYKNLTITRNSNAPSPHSATVQGRPAWYFPDGAFAGLWVPMQTGINPLY